MAAPSPSSNGSDQRIRIVRFAMTACTAAVLVTVWWSDVAVDWSTLATLVLVVAALLWTVRLRFMWQIWERGGFVVATGVIVVLVAATGGADSPYQDLFLAVPVVCAFLFPFRGLVLSLAAAVLGAFAPVLYGDADVGFVADLAADAAIWAAVSAVVFTQVRQRRGHADALRQVSEVKSLFLQATSHEVRTPLTVISGTARLLRASDDQLTSEQRVALLERLEANADKLTKLLTDLLDVDRLMRDTVALVLSPTDLADVVNDVVAGADLGGIDVTLETEPVWVAADRPKLERVVDNLVGNAIKHADASHLWVRVERDGPLAVLTVEDDGVGVPDNQKTRIFREFAQGPGRAHAASPGMGLGLSLVSRFVTLHGGTSWVEDRPGGGASFKVALPVRDDDASGGAPT